MLTRCSETRPSVPSLSAADCVGGGGVVTLKLSTVRLPESGFLIATIFDVGGRRRGDSGLEQKPPDHSR